MTKPARLAYLDWLRGVAILVMIQIHVFNSFTRMEDRTSGLYGIARSIGGLAAPLFLFIAGTMVGFRIESRDNAGMGTEARMLDVLKRAGYVMAVAELILFQQWLFQWSLANWRYLFKADILNCMAVAIAVTSVVALLPRQKRPGGAIFLAVVIASLAPVVSSLDWSGAPWLIRDYIVPNAKSFPFFPAAAYVPFGAAVGFIIHRAGERNAENAMCWMAFAGFGLIYGGEFFSNQPYSVYPHVDFWLNSPGLIAIRTGLMTLLVVVAYLWTRFGLPDRVVRQLGITSLLVYWVHIELVYGSWFERWKRHLTVDQAALAVVVLVGLMYALSVIKTRLWTRVRASRTIPAPEAAPVS